MSQNLNLIVNGLTQPEPFFTQEEYRDFCDRFYQEVRPAQDNYRLARAKSEKAARNHLVD